MHDASNNLLEAPSYAVRDHNDDTLRSSGSSTTVSARDRCLSTMPLYQLSTSTTLYSTRPATAAGRPSAITVDPHGRLVPSSPTVCGLRYLHWYIAETFRPLSQSMCSPLLPSRVQYASGSSLSTCDSRLLLSTRPDQELLLPTGAFTLVAMAYNHWPQL